MVNINQVAQQLPEIILGNSTEWRQLELVRQGSR